MALVTLAEAKEYLRVDSSDEDTLIGTFLALAGSLCKDIARLSEEDWAVMDTAEASSTVLRTREVLKVAMLYTVGYLFEHREQADFTDLVFTLRSLLFAVREGVV